MVVNPHVINQELHKQNSRDLGRIAAQIFMFFAAMFVSVWANVTYIPQWPLFIIVLIGGGFYLVPRTRQLMQSFEKNRREDNG
ncbi:MAG: hypothetical protein KAI27_06205 [Rhodospirillaceae bacterium]|nr:hypothetical protein [Rhodospirillaceae bacterium]